jgi:hypothetical protein
LPLRSAGDLLARVVREREREDHAAVLRRVADERVEPLADERREPLELADGAEADAVLHDLGALRLEEVVEQLPQRADLRGRAGPVLRAEGVQRERLEADSPALARHRAHRLRSLAVASDARERPRLGPAAVAVHDDRDVARQRSRANTVSQLVDEGPLGHRALSNTLPKGQRAKPHAPPVRPNTPAGRAASPLDAV